jgi:SNF2 family DNA or RNA helicase
MVTAELGSSVKYRGVECVLVSTEYRHRDMIRQVDGARYDPELHKWVVPRTWTACVALRGVFGDQLEVGPRLAEWSIRDHADRIVPALQARLTTSLADDDRSAAAETIRSWRTDAGFSLYPYQETGVKFLVTAARCLLTDEMGTGKTAQVIRAVRLMHELSLVGQCESPFPVLIIVPNTVKHTWVNEFKRWWPAVTPVVLGGGKTKRDKQIADADGVVIMNWESVRTHSRLAPYGSVRIKRCHVCDNTLSAEDKVNAQTRCEHCPKELNKKAWATIVCDEAHRMKDPKAKQTRAVWACATPETLYRFALTGTPIANNPTDLWSALHFIDDQSWVSKSKFIDRYCHSTPNYWGGITVTGLRADTRDEFFKAVDPRMRRMPKEAVLPFLPRKTYVERFVEMSPKQAKAYDQMSAGLAAQLEDGIVVAQNPLVQLTRLMQFASSYATLDESGTVHLEDPSCKVDALVDLLDDLDQEPLVVFAMSRQLIELASARLTRLSIPHGLITGGQSAIERQASIDAFQGGQTRVIMGTVQAGGVGITLTRSPNLAFLQRSWSLVENNQAEDRVHRIGAEVHDKINIIDIIAEGTVESRVREVVAGKWERLEEFVRDRAFMSQLLAS